MAIGSQCGEDQIFADYFGDRVGFVVDVGAADGQDNSNSWALIQRGWKGILIEPDKEQYHELATRYDGHPNVNTLNMAIGTDTGIHTFYSNRQVSTFEPSWKERCEETYGVVYTSSLVAVVRLQFALTELLAPKHIDLLTIDCESRDMDVLNSLDLSIYKPELICLECGGTIPGYSIMTRTCGNIIYRRNDENA